jgi:importin subunit beta-1
MENLSNNNVHRSVKPQILSVFGDIALAIGPEFKRFLDMVLMTLMQASQLQVDKNDYDLVDYINELRENCLEAYTGIVQGLKGDKDNANPDVFLLQPHVQYMIQFIMVIASDPDITDSLIAACAGLIGDLTSAFGGAIVPLIDNEVINNLLLKGKRSKVGKTKTLCVWAIKEVRKLKLGTPSSTTGPAPGAMNAVGAVPPTDS